MVRIGETEDKVKNISRYNRDRASRYLRPDRRAAYDVVSPLIATQNVVELSTSPVLSGQPYESERETPCNLASRFAF